MLFYFVETEGRGPTDATERDKTLNATRREGCRINNKVYWIVRSWRFVLWCCSCVDDKDKAMAVALGSFIANLAGNI